MTLKTTLNLLRITQLNRLNRTIPEGGSFGFHYRPPDNPASGSSRKKNWGGGRPGPSSFGRQQRLSEITTEPTKNLGA